MEYREFASVVYHKTDAHVKWTDTEIEIGGKMCSQQMLAFLYFLLWLRAVDESVNVYSIITI